MAKNALARQSDVKPESVKVEPKYEGRVEFEAREGCSLDLEKIHACLKGTRLSGKPGSTRSEIRYLEIVAVGEVVKTDRALLLRVKGTKQAFRLEADPGQKDVARDATPFARLEQAMARGDRAMTVTGRVKGWSGHFPAVLKEFPIEYEADPSGPDKPRKALPPLVFVTDFKVEKK